MCVTSTALCRSGYFVDGKTFSVRKNLSWDLSWSLSAHRCNVASALSATMGGTIIHICFTERNGNQIALRPFSTSYLRKILTIEQTWLGKLPEHIPYQYKRQNMNCQDFQITIQKKVRTSLCIIFCLNEGDFHFRVVQQNNPKEKVLNIFLEF